MKGDSVPPDAVARSLEKILSSGRFLQSTRLSRFLRFAVERTLQGKGPEIKEYTIGTEVYGRRSDFNPGEDSIVRTEARRLRRKLKEYYENEGKDDEVIIFFRPGSYVPVHRWRESLAGPPQGAAPATEPLWTKGDGVRVLVEPFEAHSGDALASSIAFGLSDEILHKLSRIPGVRAVLRTAFQQAGAASPLRSEGDEPLLAIGGTARVHQARLRVTANLTAANGLVLWSQRFDAPIDDGAPEKLQEAVAAALLSRIAPRQSIIRTYAGSPNRNLFAVYSQVLEAEELLEEGTTSSIEGALRKFEDLAAKAPGFGRLFTGIAQCCISLARTGVQNGQELGVRARKAGELALQLDPQMVDAHSVMGCVLAQEWTWREAEESFRAAFRLGDQHAAHREFCEFLLVLSRADEAKKHLEVAHELDPFSMRQRISAARWSYYSRSYDEDPAYPETLPGDGRVPPELALLHALTEIQMGRRTAAVAFAERIEKDTALAGPAQAAAAAEVLAWCGQEGRASSLAQQAGLLDEAAPISFFRKASLALSLKDRATCLRLLRESLHRREPELPWIAADPRFDGIRGERACADIVAQIFPQEMPAAANPRP